MPEAPRPPAAGTGPAHALLLLATACPHCAAVADAALRLVKAGELAELRIINLDHAPEAAAEAGVRSVPWLRIGAFELIGAVGYAEMRQWAQHAAAGSGDADYVAYLLQNRRLDRAAALVASGAIGLRQVLDLMADPDTPMGVRIGISALVESIAGSAVLRDAVPLLEQLTLAPAPQTRADACHFLGLAGDAGAAGSIRRLLDDEQPDVREIAAETLALLEPRPEAQSAPESTGAKP